jgi:CBS domain-containing protein
MNRYMLTVDHLMTQRVVCSHAQDDLRAAGRQMQLEDIRHLPVVDQDGRLLGMLSQGDLIRARVRGLKGTAYVREAMTTPALSVRRNTAAHEAVAILVGKKIGALPVVNEKGILVGVITETDFLVIAHEALRGLVTQAPRAEA